jgi:hypothetical protein
MGIKEDIARLLLQRRQEAGDDDYARTGQPGQRGAPDLPSKRDLDRLGASEGRDYMDFADQFGYEALNPDAGKSGYVPLPRPRQPELDTYHPEGSSTKDVPSIIEQGADFRPQDIERMQPSDEDLLELIQRGLAPPKRRSDATDYLKELQEPMIPKRVEPMHAGTVQDIEPVPYDEDDPEPEYPGAGPRPPMEQTPRDKYQEDADRVRSNRLADPYEDRGIFNFKLDDIRDVLKWGKGDEVGDDALYSLNESENPFKGRAGPIMDRLKGMNPEMDDFEFIRQMRQRLGMSKPSKLYDMIDEDRAFREVNPGRGGMFRLDQPTRDPLSDAYPQRRSRQRSATFDERFSGE